MRDTYSGGYKAALLDVYNFLEPGQPIEQTCRSKKQYQTMVRSLLELLLLDSIAREDFMNSGGACWVKQAPDGRILAIGKEREALQ